MENSHKFSVLFFAKFLQHGFLTNVKEICKILLFIYKLTLEQDDSNNNVTKTKPKKVWILEIRKSIRLVNKNKPTYETEKVLK